MKLPLQVKIWRAFSPYEGILPLWCFRVLGFILFDLIEWPYRLLAKFQVQLLGRECNHPYRYKELNELSWYCEICKLELPKQEKTS